MNNFSRIAHTLLVLSFLSPLSCAVKSKDSKNTESAAATSTSTQKSSELVSTNVLLTEEKVALMLSGGGSVGVGADVLDPRRLTAWFYGDQPIRTCFNYISDFGVSAKTVDKAIRTSIKRWQSYFASKKFQQQGEKSVNLNLKFEGRCRGEESLVLNFGTGPIFGNMRDLKAVQTLARPVAYVNKTHMSRDLRWGKGYIRFVAQGYYENKKVTFPDWKRKNSLELVITHELGHVFGFSHVDNTVMDARLIRDVFTDQKIPLSIDGRSELVYCKTCKEEYSPIKDSLKKEFLQQLGLSQKTRMRLKLVRSGEAFYLQGLKNQISLNVTKVSQSHAKSVHLSNFGWNQNGIEQVSYAKTGHILANGKKLPVILTYSSQSNESNDIHLFYLQNNEFVSAGKFQRQ